MSVILSITIFEFWAITPSLLQHPRTTVSWRYL